jgi:ABC-type uncharacterized transport system ATPase subunit
MTEALRLEGITKTFGAVQALHDADFALVAGEFHALLGENGAGKSTLMRVAAGLLLPDAGRMSVAGTPVLPRTPREARRLGIGMVHQHFSAVPAFSVAENVTLAANWSPRPGALERNLEALMGRVGFFLDPHGLTERLTVAQRQQLEILMALAGDARVLLLDEPTAVLAPPDAQAVLMAIRAFTAGGGAAVLITHKLSEALDYADRLTVLRRGRVVLTGDAADETEHSLATAMLGEPPTSGGRPSRPAPGEPVAACHGLAVPASAGGTGLRSGTLTIHRGEIVAVAAVGGNGERELLRALAGVLEPSGGQLELRGRVALIPEDRSTEGLIPAFTLAENLVLAEHRESGGSGFLIDWAEKRESAARLIAAYDIAATGPEATANSLSGGNQQRFMIARALASRPDLIVAEEPARGLDLKAADEVHARLRAAVTAGAGVLLHSADLDDLLAIADRIVVVADGRTVEPMPWAGRAEIGRLMLGGREAGQG